MYISAGHFGAGGAYSRWSRQNGVVMSGILSASDHDRVWGPGNWTYCDCAWKDTGQRCAHSTKYHDLFVPTEPSQR